MNAMHTDHNVFSKELELSIQATGILLHSIYAREAECIKIQVMHTMGSTRDEFIAELTKIWDSAVIADAPTQMRNTVRKLIKYVDFDVAVEEIVNCRLK